MTEINQDGLEWDDSGWDLTPVWTREPSCEAIESVCRQRLHIGGIDICDVSFHTEGAFNKLYMVKTKDHPLLMRVSLPVYPRHKTRGEVTTLRWVRNNTNIPVPKVFDFDDNNDNAIGFEWILMELMPGIPAWRSWRQLSMAQKVFLTQRIAEWQAQLFSRGSSLDSFRGIGTLGKPISDGELFKLEQFVSTQFFMGHRVKYDVPRGPFRSSHEWLKSYLDIANLDHERMLENPEDEDDKEEAELAIELVKRLSSLLPKIFPLIQELPERTALWHGDLGLQNILLDDKGNITAIIDWECVSAMPLWMTTSMPKFLDGAEQEECPQRETYADATPPVSENGDAAAAKDADPDKLDDEGKNGLYWIHLLEYEQTQLRKIYVDKMRNLWPSWDLLTAESGLKKDFFLAVAYCSNMFPLEKTLAWVDEVEAGEITSLVR